MLVISGTKRPNPVVTRIVILKKVYSRSADLLKD